MPQHTTHQALADFERTHGAKETLEVHQTRALFLIAAELQKMNGLLGTTISSGSLDVYVRS